MELKKGDEVTICNIESIHNNKKGIVMSEFKLSSFKCAVIVEVDGLYYLEWERNLIKKNNLEVELI